MKVFDNTERGIRLGTEMCLHVGDHVIDFEDSLLTMPGATFGNRLVNVELRVNADSKDDRGRSDVAFGGLAYGPFSRNDDAIVRVLLYVSLDGEHSAQGFDGGALSEILKWQSRVQGKSYGGELPRTAFARYVHALIRLAPGGAVEFRDVYIRPVRRTLLQVLTGAKAAREKFLATATYSYDGKKVRLTHTPPRKIGEIPSVGGSLREGVVRTAYLANGSVFGLVYLAVLGHVHGSVLWWILGCAFFAAGSTNQWMIHPSEVKSSVTKWCWASFGAFIGAFVPYIWYCLTHIAQ